MLPRLWSRKGLTIDTFLRQTYQVLTSLIPTTINSSLSPNQECSGKQRGCSCLARTGRTANYSWSQALRVSNTRNRPCISLKPFHKCHVKIKCHNKQPRTVCPGKSAPKSRCAVPRGGYHTAEKYRQIVVQLGLGCSQIYILCGPRS